MKIDKFISRIERISSIFFRFSESFRRVSEIEQSRRTPEVESRRVSEIEQIRRILEVDSRRALKLSINNVETSFLFKIRKPRVFSKSKLADL